MFWLACVPFFRLFTSSGYRQLISEPCQDWKDLLEEIKNHVFTECLLYSMARLNEFMRTINDPEKVVGVTIPEKNKKTFKNREILRSIIKWLEFCGGQGLV